MLAEQHVYGPEQGRIAWNVQQAIFKRAAREYELAARAEVHVAVTQATEIWTIMDAFENKQSKLGRLIKLHHGDEKCRRRRTEKPEKKFVQ